MRDHLGPAEASLLPPPLRLYSPLYGGVHLSSLPIKQPPLPSTKCPSKRFWYRPGPLLRDPTEISPRYQGGKDTRRHQQPEVNYLPRFSPQLISLEEQTLRVYFSGEIDLLENLDIVHITLLVDTYRGTSLIRNSPPLGPYGRPMPRVLWRS